MAVSGDFQASKKTPGSRSHSRSGRFGKENILHLPGIEPWCLGFRACSLVTMLTELSLLFEAFLYNTEIVTSHIHNLSLTMYMQHIDCGALWSRYVISLFLYRLSMNQFTLLYHYRSYGFAVFKNSPFSYSVSTGNKAFLYLVLHLIVESFPLQCLVWTALILPTSCLISSIKYFNTHI